MLIGLGALAASLMAQRRAAQGLTADGPSSEGNWSPVARPEPTLSDARSMR